MGKKKSWKQNTDQIAKQQLHGTISGSVKKNKNPTFKKTPIGKVALINNSKIQKKEVKSVSSEKNAQKSYVNAENKNQDLPKKAFKNSIKQSSSNRKQSFSSKAKNESLKGKYICNPEEMLEHIDSDSDSHISEETSQEDSSLNKMDESIEDEEEEDSDTDILDILGKSLKDESDEDDEDYENMEEEDNEDEDDEDKDDNDERRFKYKGVKMFRGLRSDAKKDESDEENGKLVQTDMDLDNYESSSSDDFMGFLDSDEYEYSNEEDEHEDMYTDKNNDDYENQVQNKNANKTDTSMEIDKDDKDEDDDDDDDDSEVDGDEDDNDDDDDDDDDDTADEETGLKALLGKSIADDDDDKDFNEEDEDDEDDDISSEDEDDEENNTVKQMKDFDDDDDDEDFNKDDEDCDSSEYDEYDEENNTVKQIKGKEKREEAANQKGIREFKFMNPDMKQRYEEELERKIVVVQNISKDATRDKMIELFRQFGGLKKMSLTPLTVIKTIKIATKTDDGTPNVSYGTLHELLSLIGRFLYATEKSAQDAVRALHGKMVDGHYLSVQTLAQFNGPYDPEKCVFITNLKKDVKLNDIWKAFLKYGDIVCIELMRNNETKACKNGYIQFYTKEAVASILNSRSTIKVKGRQVIVSKLKCEKEAMIMYREAKMKVKKDCSTTEENEREDFKRKPQQIINDKIAQKRANSKAVFVHSKENVKKQQGENESKSTVFQGQKVHLKSKKKKKSKLDKKRKEMAKKLTAKSAKI